jgi:acetyl-CoA carboxylase biotin carboxyl carrier protein
LRRNSATGRAVAGPAAESAPTTPPIRSRTTAKSKPPSEPGLFDVTAPLLGVFYRAPKPGEPSFIEVGSKVEKETVIGIIEVMKLMNSVRAGVKGEVVEILGENDALVEYGEVLLRVRPSE